MEALDESERHARESRTRSAEVLLPRIRSTTSFDHCLNKYKRSHPDVAAIYDDMVRVLAVDPCNHTRSHPIMKLVNFTPPYYRYTMQRWRFHYDIHNGVVWLNYCGLRRENTYKQARRRRRTRHVDPRR